MNIANYFTENIGVILVIIFTIGIVSIIVIEMKLRINYPDVWEMLGKPNIILIWKWDRENGIPLYLNNKGYIKQDDMILTAACKITVLISYFFIFIVFLYLILTILELII